ncbi:MAG: Crp/Fnr family transcriptional regulator [bacterium]|nr:Crp/Fnr family transcriptional regulator [bacterium]
MQYKPLCFRKRDIVLHADDGISDIFYIKNGYVRVYRISELGEELTLSILKPGDLFPMLWEVKDAPNPYYMEAITDLEVWRFPRDQFLSFVKDRPDLFYDLTSNLMVRFGGMLNRMEYLITSRAYNKVAATLFTCAKRFGVKQKDEVIVDVPLTHKDIATLVGITRETTCLEMKKLERKGLISHLGRLLVIKDMKRLEAESQLNNEFEEPLYYSL